MNNFERHGIKHLSPSSINMFADCAGAWAARYLFNKNFKFGVAAQIGVLTERVVEEVLLGSGLGDALDRAHSKFNKENALNVSEKDLKRIHDIESMAILALEALTQYGEPEVIQKLNGNEQQKIEIICNGGGWSIPVIGYLDFVYPKHGLIIDLKTTLRMPSSMSMAHQRQAAIYQAAKGNMGVKFLYVTPKKYSLLEVDDIKPVLENVKAIAARMNNFLALDVDTIKEIVPVNAASFYWSGDENILKELYGL
jgi:hypothetical protein